jgi:L-fucose mutarotase/ribose pyranase (RbsD/FucU family)
MAIDVFPKGLEFFHHGLSVLSIVQVLADANFPSASVAKHTTLGEVRSSRVARALFLRRRRAGHNLFNLPLPTFVPRPHSLSAHTQEIRIDGTGIPELLKGIMSLLPLDETAPPAILMGMMPCVLGPGCPPLTAGVASRPCRRRPPSVFPRRRGPPVWWPPLRDAPPLTRPPPPLSCSQGAQGRRLEDPDLGDLQADCQRRQRLGRQVRRGGALRLLRARQDGLLRRGHWVRPTKAERAMGLPLALALRLNLHVRRRGDGFVHALTHPPTHTLSPLPTPHRETALYGNLILKKGVIGSA